MHVFRALEKHLVCSFLVNSMPVTHKFLVAYRSLCSVEACGRLLLVNISMSIVVHVQVILVKVYNCRKCALVLILF